MIIHVILFTLIWSQMPDGYFCLGREDQSTKVQKQCESCLCEDLVTNNNCTFQLCTHLWILCRETSKLNDTTQKPQIVNTRDSVMIKLMRNRRREDRSNPDNLDHDETIIDNRDSTTPIEKMLYKRSTELQKREQNKTTEECEFGTNTMIRVLSVDYKMPALNSENAKINAVTVMILHSTIVVIGITICIIVYRNYGYDEKERRHNTYIDEPTWRHFPLDAVRKTDKLQAAMTNKFLLSDRPPSYGAFVV